MSNLIITLRNMPSLAVLAACDWLLIHFLTH